MSQSLNKKEFLVKRLYNGKDDPTPKALIWPNMAGGFKTVAVQLLTCWRHRVSREIRRWLWEAEGAYRRRRGGKHSRIDYRSHKCLVYMRHMVFNKHQHISLMYHSDYIQTLPGEISSNNYTKMKCQTMFGCVWFSDYCFVSYPICTLWCEALSFSPCWSNTVMVE